MDCGERESHRNRSHGDEVDGKVSEKMKSQRQEGLGFFYRESRG